MLKLETIGNTVVCLVLSLSLAACGKKDDPEPPSVPCASSSSFYQLQSQLTSYSGNEQFAGLANRCLFAPNDALCSYNDFSLLADRLPDKKIEVADIMNYTVATHQWMSDRFRTLLESYPDELLQMFKHVTAIVISSDARPSHYWIKHGAIVLDPYTISLNALEDGTITKLPDCRSNNFRENTLDFVSYGLEFNIADKFVGTEERSLGLVGRNMGKLLAHELAHAMDFTLELLQEPIEEGEKFIFQLYDEEELLSKRLSESYPLSSPSLISAANYFYGSEDREASALALEGTSAEVIASEFAKEGAVNLYAYYNQFEDFAMLIEAHMGRKHFETAQALVVIEETQATGEDRSCATTNLIWGQKNRDLSEPLQIRTKAALALAEDTMEQTTALELNESLSGLSTNPVVGASNFCEFLGL